MRPQRLAVAEQEVEGAVARHLRHQLGQRLAQVRHARQAGVVLGQLLQQPAEGAFAVGLADRVVGGVQLGLEVLEVAVVREHPVAPPQLALERVGVLERHAALRRLADVRQDVAAADRVVAHHLRHRRFGRAVVIDEQPRAGTLEEGDAEAVLVFDRTLREAREAEDQVGGRVGVEAEQLAHGVGRGSRPQALKSFSMPRSESRWPGLLVSLSRPLMLRRRLRLRWARQITRSASHG